MRFTIDTEYDQGDQVYAPDNPGDVGTIRHVWFDEQTGEDKGEEYKVEYTVRWTSTTRDGRPIETKHQASELMPVDAKEAPGADTPGTSRESR